MGEEDGAPDVEVVDCVIVLDLDFLKAPLPLSACVVDQDVDLQIVTLPPEQIGDQLLGTIQAAQIGADGMG